MSTAEIRREKILEFIKIRSYAAVSVLAAEFGVTTATIRSDLQALEENGVIMRSHGGAIPVLRPVRDVHEDVKSVNNVPEKKRIAQVAADLVSDGDSIIIASGSTMVYFSEMLRHDIKLNAVTPSVRIALKLLANPSVKVMQLGGEIYPNTLSVRGSIAESELDAMYCNKVFFGVEGFDIECGLTCATIAEAHLTCKMMEHASQSIVLADSSKFGRKGFGHICGLVDIDVLITDGGIQPEVVELLETKGIKVLIA